MASISIDNGLTYLTAREALCEIGHERAASRCRCVDWETITMTMDSDTRERVHMEIAPCTKLAFLERYLEVAGYDLVIG